MGTKIRNLTDTATSIGDNDFLVIASSDNKTKKISGLNFKDAISVGLGVPVIASERIGAVNSIFAEQGEAGITVEMVLSYHQPAGASGRGINPYGVTLRFTNPARTDAAGNTRTISVTIAGNA